MTEPFCKNCGYMAAHHAMFGTRMWCRTTEFQLDEPMKAKAGVRYYHRATDREGIGLVSGLLAISRHCDAMLTDEWETR